MTVPLIFAFVHLLGFLASVQAVMSVRTAQGAIAWAVSLNTLPWVAVPAYVLFGRSKFEGFVSLRRRGLDQTTVQSRQFRDGLAARNLLALRDSEQSNLVEKLAKLPFTLYNDVDLLVDGEATYDSLFAGIERAERYVLVQFYILRDDDVGGELKRRLVDLARAGVRCYVLYDGVGTGDITESYLEELRAAGCEVSRFDTRLSRIDRLLQINFRNHRKIVVVDGREAWVGGLNVGDEYLGRDPRFGYWRDTHVRVAGPVVQSVQISFVEDWHWATSKLLGELEWDPEGASEDAEAGVLALPSGPADQLETATLFHMHAISSARKRLWIATPYFVPDEQFVTALQLAALRGVDVRILVPEKSDSRLVNLSGWSYVPELERAGIRSFRHRKGFMHQKVMLIDDTVATVGTANFDNRSFRLNFEITMVIVDRAFAQDVEAMLLQDFGDSVETFAKDLEKKGLWFRVAVRFARLMAPVQ